VGSLSLLKMIIFSNDSFNEFLMLNYNGEI